MNRTRMKRRASVRWVSALVAVCWLGTGLAQAQSIYLVVAAANPLRSLTTKEAQSLYMGRTRYFSSGEPATIFDLPRGHPLHDSFYQSLTGMTPAQVNSYWSRLMFTGQTLPPQALPSEAHVVEQLKRNSLAIGYLSQEPSDPALRTVLTLKTAPN